MIANIISQDQQAANDINRQKANEMYSNPGQGGAARTE
jgi:hypothetical protein